MTNSTVQTTHSSIALREVECQHLKSARRRTPLQPRVNEVAYAGALWGGSQQSIPHHTRTHTSREARHSHMAYSTPVNRPQKLVLGASSDVLIQAVSRNTLMSVNRMNWALLLPKPRETTPFQLAQLLYPRIAFSRTGGGLPKCSQAPQVFNCNEGSLFQGPHPHKQKKSPLEVISARCAPQLLSNAPRLRI